MSGLEPRHGFDWGRVTWGRPDSVRSALCSYCAAAIGENDCPLVIWNRHGFTAQFCDRCMVEKWGFSPVILNDDE